MNINSGIFSVAIDLENSGIIMGKIKHDYDKYLIDNCMEKSWQCFRIPENSPYCTFTYKIYPKIMAQFISKFLSCLEIRKRFQWITFAYRSNVGGVLMRKEGISKHFKQMFGNRYEIASWLVTFSNKELMNGKNIKVIRRYMISPFGKEESSIRKKFEYDTTYIKRDILLSDINVLQMRDNSFNFLSLPTSHNDFLKTLLSTSMDICHQLINGVSCLIEDTDELKISHFICSLTKIFIDRKYCTGYLDIINLEWINQGYLFSIFSDSNGPNSGAVLSFRLFHFFMQYLVYCFPNKFEFNLEFLDRVENELLYKPLIYTNKSVVIYALDKLYFDSFDYLTPIRLPLRTLYLDIALENEISGPKISYPMIWSSVFNAKKYQKFLVRFFMERLYENKYNFF